MKSLKKLTIFRYFFVGIIVVTIDFTTFNTLLFLKTPLLFATTFGFLTGTIAGFFLHNNFTFQNKTTDTALESKKFFKFVTVAAVGLLLTDFIVYFFTEKIHFHHNISKSIAVFVSVAWAYSASRWWVFIPKKNQYLLTNVCKKILIFSPFYPPHIGGLEGHSDEFNKHLSEKNIEISVFTPRLPEDAPENEMCHNKVKILRFPAFEFIHNYPIPKFWQTHFWRQWNSLSNENYDLIISRTRFFFPSLMALWYAHRKNIPLLHIEHGSDFAQFNTTLKTTLGKLYDWTLGHLILRHADFVIGNSQASANFVKKISGRTDCQVIYRGASREGIESSQPRLDLQEKYVGKVILAFIGRLIHGKGAHDLITALAQLKHDDIVTFIIGGGPEETRLKNMVAEHHLEKQIIFFGNLPFPEAISILKTADIAVNPSYTEGLPTSVTEAALCHKAIIATDVGGTREIITGDNDGILITPGDIPNLAKKMELLITNRWLRETFGENAYQGIKNKFDWNHSTNQYLEVFSKLLNNKKEG